MLVTLIIYLIFSYIYISRRIINLCNLSLLYIMAGVYIGEFTINYSARWVNLNDFTYAENSIYYLKLGFYLVIFSILVLQILFKERNLKKSNSIAFGSLFSTNINWFLILLISIPLYLVFIDIYIPVFEDKTYVSKYFQDRLNEFIPYRPFYTLSINGLSTLLFLQINYFLFTSKKVNFLKLILNRNFIKLIFIMVSLFFTAKRGQLFFPIFISVISYLIYRKKIAKLSLFGSLMIILAGISRNFSKILEGDFRFEDIVMSLSTSFFVSVRELTRVLYHFNLGDHNFLYGKTYIAGLFSFIPTQINTLKANYNYMRYTSIISNQNPDDFGGMRSTYIGEAYVNFGKVGIVIIPFIFAFIIYIFHLLIRKYSYNNFIYYISTLWIFKMVILPIYENGSSMFLFFIITTIFMMLPSLKMVIKDNKLLLRILFINRKANAKDI